MAFSLFSSLALSSERGHLMLRAFVAPSTKTKIIQTRLSSSKSLVTFSSTANSKFLNEGQKLEIEGLDQSGLEGQMKEIAGNGKVIEYQLLINHLKTSMPDHAPIFLKISAN